MTVSETQANLAGVRPVTGERVGRLTWVTVGVVGGRGLESGTRVLVRDGGREWLGEVVVPPGQIVESPPLSGLPVILRLATDADLWPAVPDRAGRALLDSLQLPAELLKPPVN